MTGSRFSEEQIIGILRVQEGGDGRLCARPSICWKSPSLGGVACSAKKRPQSVCATKALSMRH